MPAPRILLGGRSRAWPAICPITKPHGATEHMDHFIGSTVNPRYLEPALPPTEQCNFRCTYCDEDFAIRQISPRVQAVLKQFPLKRVPSLRVARPAAEAA